MSIAYSEITPAVRFSPALIESRPTSVAAAKCLVVSNNFARGEMLERAALESGWEVIQCDDAEQALALAARNRFLLALVDLDAAAGETPPGFADVVQRLAGQSELLLAVCGTEEDALQEIWARQLGVWLYLPGVDADCDMHLVCSEARLAVEQTNAALARSVGAASSGV